MRFAAVVTQKDESGLLPEWLAYYSNLCGGWEHLYVFDDDSTHTDVIELLKGAEAKGATVQYSRGRWQGLENKGALISNLLRQLGTAYDWYFPVDCDEFVCVDADGTPVISREAIEQEISRAATGGHQYLRINSFFLNIPHSSKVYWSAQGKKVVVRGTQMPINLDAGLHLYDWGSEKDTVEPELISSSRLAHIHFHHKPYHLALRTARQRLKGHIPDFSPETLLAYKGPSFHMKWLLEVSAAEYISFLRAQKQIDIGEAFSKLKISVPFQLPP
jgi:hypothetical protein